MGLICHSAVTVRAAGLLTFFIEYADTTGPGTPFDKPVIVNFLQPASEIQIGEFNEFTVTLAQFYLDDNILLRADKIVFRQPPDIMINELVSIVNGSVKFLHHDSRKPMENFSARFFNALRRMEGNVLDQSAFGEKSALDKRTLQNAFLTNCKSGIGRAMIADIKLFSEKNLLSLTSSDAALMDDETLNAMLDEMLDPNGIIEPLPIKIDDDLYATVHAPDRSALPYPGHETGPGPDADFAEKVFEQLQKQNSKLDNMQTQIDELKSEQIRIWQQRQDETNGMLQKQIDDLRVMVIELVQALKQQPATAQLPSTTAPLAEPQVTVSVENLPAKLEIFFGKNAVELNAGSILMINEVVDILARNPKLDIIITGHADRTGSELHNLLLSQQRANSVKKFFTQSGLEQARFITKYVGHRDSGSENADDRKVTIEFIGRQQ